MGLRLTKGWLDIPADAWFTNRQVLVMQLAGFAGALALMGGAALAWAALA
jgi:hypothetical protein